MMSEGTKNILEAMIGRGISKVVGCMSGMTHRCSNVFESHVYIFERHLLSWP